MITHARRRAAGVVGIGALLCSALSLAAAPGGRAAGTTPPPPCDWPMFGHDPGRSFASAENCNAITPLTAATMKPKWFFNTSAPVTAQPAVVDGVVYAGAFDGNFYAISATQTTPNASALWTFDATKYDGEKGDYGVFPDSPAIVSMDVNGTTKNLVIIGGGATLFVLDGGTGALLASQCVDVVDSNCHNGSGKVTEIEGSPVPVKDADGGYHVIFGLDHNEADPSGPGGVISLKLHSVPTSASSTGVKLDPTWWFNPETGATTTGALSPVETDHGCGDVWSSPTVDPKAGLVFFGTGNCNHPQNVTSSSVKLVESTFAIGLDDGVLRWQATPHDVANGKDLDFGATPNILPNTTLVGEGGKDGYYYLYNEATGSAAPGWPVRVSTGSSIGGIIPSTAVGVFSNHDPAVFVDTAIPVATGDPQGSISNDVMHPNQAFGVHAIDVATHSVVWDAPVGPSYGAAVYSNGVVFAPDTFTDSLLALDADTGAVLRNQPLDAPPSSPVAVSGDSVYMGAGTTENSPPLNTLSSFGGIWAFQTTIADPGVTPTALPTGPVTSVPALP